MAVKQETGSYKTFTSPLGLGAYVQDKMPHYDKMGRLIVDHAPTLKYDFSANFWQLKNQEMNSRIDRSDCQVVVIAPNRDANARLLYPLSHKPIGPYPMASTTETIFPEGGLDIRVKNESMASSVYIAASIYNERDFGRVIKIADHYRSTLNAQYITLLTSYLSTGRQDKDVDRDGNYRPNPIDIRANMKSLSGLVDRIFVIEPHSSAAQTNAAEVGIPYAPISTWEVLLRYVLGNKIRFIHELNEKFIKVDKKMLVGISPDIGRCIANERISEEIDIQNVSFEKTRVDGETIVINQLSDDKKRLLNGKIGLMFDDVGSTMKTAKEVALKAREGGIKAIIMLLAHLELAGNWEENIDLPFPSAIIATDTHDPIGNYLRAPNIKIIEAIAPLIIDLIKADIKGVNFWTDPKWQKLVLQSKADEFEVEKKT